MSEPVLFYISFGFTIGLVTVKFIVAYLLFKIFQKSKENELVLGASLLFLFNGIGRIFMIIFDYVLTRFNSNFYSTYLIFYKIGFFIGFTGIACLLFISERVILKKKSKYMITIVFSIFLIIALIPVDINIVQIITIIPTTFAMIYLPFSYLYLARYDKIRIRALSIFAGYFLFFLVGFSILAEGIVQFYISLNPTHPLEIRSIIHIISVFFKVLGMGLILYGYRR
ncbi:MAG: hypothetical protein ACFFBP_03395 [Promethearchaeota archaeon]